jgi:hypothetical protein
LQSIRLATGLRKELGNRPKPVRLVEVLGAANGAVLTGESSGKVGAEDMIEAEVQPVSARKHHEIWIEQCEAAQTIKTRYGLKAAFDYVVGEKLINFASAASQHPEFARQLPRFVSEVRRMFTSKEIGVDLVWLERMVSYWGWRRAARTQTVFLDSG